MMQAERSNRNVCNPEDGAEFMIIASGTDGEWREDMRIKIPDQCLSIEDCTLIKVNYEVKVGQRACASHLH